MDKIEDTTGNKKQQHDFRFLNELIASTGVKTDQSKSEASLQAQALDIRAYTSQIKSQLSKLEEECMTDFMSLNTQALQLYTDINKSETILHKINGVVHGFQDNLEHISHEVKTLQQRSESYHMQLNNRKNLNKLMNNYLDCTFLSQEFIEALC